MITSYLPGFSSSGLKSAEVVSEWSLIDDGQVQLRSGVHAAKENVTHKKKIASFSHLPVAALGMWRPCLDRLYQPDEGAALIV